MEVIITRVEDALDHPRAFGRFCLVGLAVHLSYALSRFPVLPLYARSLGLSNGMIGLVVAASTITGIFLKLPAGRMSDLLGRRPLLILSACLFAFPPFLYPLAGAGLALMLLRFIHGAATGTFGPVSSAIVVDVAEPARRGERLSTFSSATLVGKSLGPLIGGYLIVGTDFHWPFLASGVAGVAALGVALTWTRETRATVAAGSFGVAEFFHGVREVARQFGVMATSVVEGVQFLATGALDAFLPIYASEVVGLSGHQIGWLVAGQIVTTLVAKPILGRFSDRTGRRPQIVVGLLIGALALGLIRTAHGFTALILLSALYGAGVAVTTSATAALVTDLVRSDRYGTAHGVFGTIMDVGHAAGPITAGLLADQLGVARELGLIGIFLACSAVGFAVLPAFTPQRPVLRG